MEINIVKGKGIAFGIKTALNDEGVDTSKINGSIWSKIMSAVSEQEPKPYRGGDEFVAGTSDEAKKSWKTNFVVSAGKMTIADNIWNSIKSIVTGKATSAKNGEQTPAKPSAQTQVEKSSVEVPPAKPSAQTQVEEPSVEVPPAKPSAQTQVEKSSVEKSVSTESKVIPIENKRATEPEIVKDSVPQESATENPDIADNNNEKGVLIGNPLLGKKQYIPEDKLVDLIGQNTIPDGVKCKCDKDGNITFKNKKTNKAMTAEEVKDFIKQSNTKEVKSSNTNAVDKAQKQYEVTPEVKTRISKMQSSISGLKFTTDSDGNTSLVEGNYTFSAARASILNKEENITKMFNSVPSRVMDPFGRQKCQALEIDQAKYQKIMEKPEENRTEKDKAFIKFHEKNISKLITEYDKINASKK